MSKRFFRYILIDYKRECRIRIGPEAHLHCESDKDEDDDNKTKMEEKRDIQIMFVIRG